MHSGANGPFPMHYVSHRLLILRIFSHLSTAWLVRCWSHPISGLINSLSVCNMKTIWFRSFFPYQRMKIICTKLALLNLAYQITSQTHALVKGNYDETYIGPGIIEWYDGRCMIEHESLTDNWQCTSLGLLHRFKMHQTMIWQEKELIGWRNITVT